MSEALDLILTPYPSLEAALSGFDALVYQ